MRPLLRLALLLFVFSLAGCSAEMRALTPEQAAQTWTVRMKPEAAPTFRVLGKRASAQGTVVLFSYVHPPSNEMPAAPAFGYALVEQSPIGSWQIIASAAGTVSPQPREHGVAYYDGSGSDGAGRGDWSIVYGQVVAPEVIAVEVTFANGQSYRDDATDGMFVLVAPDRTYGCELRVLGAENRVLSRVNMITRQLIETDRPRFDCTQTSAQ